MRYVVTKGKRIWTKSDGCIPEKNSRLFYDIIQVLEALGLVTRNKRKGYVYMRQKAKGQNGRYTDNYYLEPEILKFVGAELNESFSIGKATHKFLEEEKANMANIQSQKLELELLSDEVMDMDMDMEDTDEEVLFDCFNPKLFD